MPVSSPPRTTTNTERITKGSRAPLPPLPFLPSLLLLLPLLSILSYTSYTLHYTLPTPLPPHDPTTLAPQFSELEAMKYVQDLAVHSGDGAPRYRIVGTEEMVETERYLLGKVEGIKSLVESQGFGQEVEIEVWHQVGSGEHLFDFMDKLVWKKYLSIGNVIVRLSSRRHPRSKDHSILVNAHTDSTLPSPGAADDLVGVGVMMECLRVLSMEKGAGERLRNSVVFLFNGGEESLQDASHLFITQHPLRHTVRAVINLEACGVGGPEIVFQATSEEMIRALGKTPRPYGTVLASEIFSTGLILSDTDFRQFATYGNLTGLDMALVQNSYLYHTRLDLPQFIEPGAMQHMGENTLALLRYLTSNETSLGKGEEGKQGLALVKRGEMVYFSGLGGWLFLVYTRQEATRIYTLLATLAVVFVTARVDWNRKGVHLAGVASVGGSFVAALLGANVAAVVTSKVMGKSMTWFRHEALPLLVYGPPAILSVLLFQLWISSRVRSPSSKHQQAESSLLEHSILLGQLVHYTLLLLLGHALGVGSSYLFAIAVVASLTAVGVNDFLLRPGKTGRSVHLATYFVLQIAPLLLGIEGLVGFLDLFVPLTGRLGAEAPVDFIIASLVAGVGFLAVPMILPFCHRFGPKVTARMALFFTFVTAGTLGWFTRPSWQPYDSMHPKRILCLHMENITTTPPHFDLHVASVDGVPFGDLVVAATKGLTAENSVPEPTFADDKSSDWDIIFPVSQFLTTYKVPLPPTAVSYSSPFTDTFTVKATRSVLNSITQTRALDIEMLHPGLIWPVVAFDADVISWDLPKAPGRGVTRHHVKSVSGFGVTKFTLSLVIKLTQEQFDASVREQQRDKNQRADSSLSDQRLARLKVDYSGLDSKGMWPSSRRYQGIKEKPGMRFFERFEQQLPDSVDAMLLSAVASVAYI